MLGPLEVWSDDGAAVSVPGARLRSLLIVLALEPGQVVSTARLIDAIWGDEPPAAAANALQALVSRLRRLLPAGIESHPTGYRLAVEPDAVDVVRFERLAAAGRTGLPDDPAGAARILRDALQLWRGPALQDVDGETYFEAPLARLTELRLAAVQDRVEADLRLGRGAELVAELTALVAEHPLRERLVAALMRALAAAGRTAEALTAFERARRALADELGTDPSPELSAVHTAVLRGELAAESTVDVRRTNLRAVLTSFVGRDSDLTQVGKLIGEHRLVTLTGPGGAGKTRLSLEVARTLVDQTPDGVWLIELAPLTDGADVPQAVLSALGLRDQSYLGQTPTGDPVDRLAAALGTWHALIVLDNCEHLIEPVAELADRLLGDCPRLRILASSREPLGITGEALWPVEPLPLPPEDATVLEATTSPAVRLLADRASAAKPGFVVAPENVGDVVRICRALDGMPLAIELAAARLRTMTTGQLAARLDDRFRLLTGGSRTARPRHQTLRAVVDWSWELLADQERALLRRLSVFAGGATVEAAEQVCADDVLPAEQVLDLLAALADKSLLVASPDGRYRMLETVKAYGLARLEEAGELEAFRQAHARYYVDLVEEADPHLRRAEQLAWMQQLDAEHDDIHAALRNAIAAGAAESAVRLVAAAGWYWFVSGRQSESVELAGQALAVPGVVDEETRAAGYAMTAVLSVAGLGDQSRSDGWFAQAREYTGESRRYPVLRLIRPLGFLLSPSKQGDPLPLDVAGLLDDEDPWLRAAGQLVHAVALLNGGADGVAEAEASLRAAADGFRAVGERWGISLAVTVLADLMAWRGDLAAALAYYEEAVVVVGELASTLDVVQMRIKLGQLRWQLGDADGSARALADAERDAARVGWGGLVLMAQAKADLARWTGDLPAARAEIDRAEALLENVGLPGPAFRAILLDSQAYVDTVEGDLDLARQRRAEELRYALQASNAAPLVGHVLIGIADLALHQGRPDEAATLLAAGVAIRGTADLFTPDAVRVDKAARAALGEPAVAEAARRGGAATLATVQEIAAPTLYGSTGR